MSARIAIIGAGIAGISLARLLVSQLPRLDVTIFEKSRGVGGRMATRYIGTQEFDHGAQFFTVRSTAFESFLEPYEAWFQCWNPRVTTLSPDGKPYGRIWFEPHYVGVPRMNSLCRGIMAAPDLLNVRTQQQVQRLSGCPGEWFLEIEGEAVGPFDWVISTAPAPQTAALLGMDLSRVVYAPAFALMVPVERAQLPLFDAAVIKDSLLDWVATGSTKPGRGNQGSLVAHASGRWSETHLDASADHVRDEMIRELTNLGLGGCISEAAILHRWRFARVLQPLDEPCLIDSQQRIAGAGDWCIGARVEDAFSSALRLSQKLTAHLDY